MAWHLFRLGRWSFRHRRIVAGFWVALLLVVGTGALTLSGKTSDQFTLPGIESTKAFDLIKERTPSAAPDGATARVVFQAPEGERLTTGRNQSLVRETLAATKTGDVTTMTDPFTTGTVSQDGRTAYATVSYDKASIELTTADKNALTDAPEKARDAGLRVEIGGDALQTIPETGVTEGLGVLIAIVVLLITFGSLLVAGMPLLTALIGVGIGVASITTLTGFIDLGSTTPILATMLGLAVGIDYALFIVSRYRYEVKGGRDYEDAAARAVGTAGTAVVFAGLTVIIALAGLSVVNISFLTQMGLAAAGTVAVAVLIALTLLPAIFGFAKGRVFSGKLAFLKEVPDPADQSGRRTTGRRWADLVTKHKAVTFVGGLLVAGVLAVPVFSMQLALPDDGTAPAGSGPRAAYDLISENFGAGTNGPLLVVVDTKGVSGSPGEAVNTVVGQVQSVETDIATVVPPLTDPSNKQAAAAYEKQLSAAQYATITVIPKSGPSDADTQALVDDIRTAVADQGNGADVLVTGQTALGVDISESLANAFPKYLLVVVGFAFILLALVFRSILVPLKATVGFLISVCVSLGTTVAVFQWGWLSQLIGIDKPGPVLFLLPLLLTGILFGLAMDYEVFLVSRMREEFVHGDEPTEAVVHGFQYGARVVTAAAAIMIGVFGSFALGDDAIVKSIGFGLAIGVLADAFLVRMTLVPAFMALLGRAMWWLPAWLDRLLPNLDIEGESLKKRVEEEADGSDGRGGRHLARAGRE